MIALVPGARALLPRYASIEDPIPDLRAACRLAVSSLGPRVRVVAADGSAEVAESLVVAAGARIVTDGETGVLVVGNGSAKRTEQAPGHLDERAAAYDDDLGAALAGELAALADLDLDLAAELWADVECLRHLPALVAPHVAGDVHYDDAPFGVQYWVITWP